MSTKKPRDQQPKPGKAQDRSKRGKPRVRVVPWWRRPIASALAALMVIGAVAGGGWWTVKNDWIGRAATSVWWEVIALTVDLDFTIRDVLVTGRHETSRDALMRAVKLERGAPILAFDTQAAKRRIEALPWVRTAAVERLLPDTVVVRIKERQALALWQRKGRFALIDHDGRVITDKGLERFSDLLVVVGDDAPGHAAELLRMLAAETALMNRVKAGVRVGARRWNLRLDNGIDVLLPEEEAAKAWMRLSAYEAKHKVLARDIKVLDLRLPDRVVVRRRAATPGMIRASGRET